MCSQVRGNIKQEKEEEEKKNTGVTLCICEKNVWPVIQTLCSSREPAITEMHSWDVNDFSEEKTMIKIPADTLMFLQSTKSCLCVSSTVASYSRRQFPGLPGQETRSELHANIHTPTNPPYTRSCEMRLQSSRLGCFGAAMVNRERDSRTFAAFFKEREKGSEDTRNLNVRYWLEWLLEWLTCCQGFSFVWWQHRLCSFMVSQLLSPLSVCLSGYFSKTQTWQT